MLEKFAFDDGDDWGEERGEQVCDALEVLAAHMLEVDEHGGGC